MPSLETTTRNAVAAVVGEVLTAAAVTHTVTASYDAIPEAESIAPDTVEAYVYPGVRTAVSSARESRETRITCYVALYFKLSTDESARNNEIDVLMEYAAGIESGLHDSPAINFVEFENGTSGREPYSLDALRESNLFQTVIKPTVLSIEVD